MPSDMDTGAISERISHLQRRVLEYRPLPQHYNNALMFSVAIGGLASLIRGYYGWSYEEAGILLNVAFWGGYGLAALVLGPIVLLAFLREIRQGRDLKELKKANAIPDGMEFQPF